MQYSEQTYKKALVNLARLRETLGEHERAAVDFVAEAIAEKADREYNTKLGDWVSVETPPTTQGWYHVAILDLKTGKYTVEQDLYSIELAKTYGHEPGFCKANRWEERERIDYWCRFPDPPYRRPPERENA